MNNNTGIEQVLDLAYKCSTTIDEILLEVSTKSQD